MATEYVNPEWTGSSDGSIALPWKSGNDATPANNLELLWKSDVETPDVLTQIEIDGLDNLTFGYYGSGAKPIIQCYTALTVDTEWTNEGSDIWSYSVPAPYDIYIAVMGLGSLSSSVRDPFKWNQQVNHYIESDPFTEYGQWDYTDGNPAELRIYSPQNPIFEWGTIYITTGNKNSAFLIQTDVTPTTGSSNIIIEGLNFQYCHTPAKPQGQSGFRNSNILIRNCISESAFFGLRLSSYNESSVFEDNEIYSAMNVGIGVGGILEGEGCKIIRNSSTDQGYGAQGAGIYGTIECAAGKPLLIGENIIDRCHRGIFNPGQEAFGIYFDSGQASGRNSEYINVIGNTVKNLRDTSTAAAIHVNGGQTAVNFISNKTINCNVGFNGSDAYPQNNDQYNLLFNTFHEVDTAFTFSRNTSVGQTVDIKMYGNVATAASTAGTKYAITLDNNFDDLTNVLSNDGNWLYGFDTLMYRYQDQGTVQHSVGTNTETATDPLLDTNGDFESNSPARRSSPSSIYSSLTYDELLDAKGRNKLRPFDVGAHGFSVRYKSPIGLHPK